MNNLLTIGVIGAMDSEIEDLVSLIGNADKTDIYGLTFYSGIANGKNLLLLKSGVGKVNAARCTQILIDKFDPDYIINSGIAGGIAPELCVGDVVVGDELVQHDFDVSGLGYAKGYICTGVNPDQPTIFNSDEILIEKLEKAAQSVPGNVHRGRIASGDLFVSSPDDKSRIRQEFSVSAAEMEGAAVAQTAAYGNIPFAVLRVISDQADGSAAESYTEFESEAAKKSSDVITELLRLI